MLGPSLASKSFWSLEEEEIERYRPQEAERRRRREGEDGKEVLEVVEIEGRVVRQKRNPQLEKMMPLDERRCKYDTSKFRRVMGLPLGLV